MAIFSKVKEAFTKPAPGTPQVTQPSEISKKEVDVTVIEDSAVPTTEKVDEVIEEEENKELPTYEGEDVLPNPETYETEEGSNTSMSPEDEELAELEKMKKQLEEKKRARLEAEEKARRETFESTQRNLDEREQPVPQQVPYYLTDGECLRLLLQKITNIEMLLVSALSPQKAN